eukprot:685409_1
MTNRKAWQRHFLSFVVWIFIGVLSYLSTIYVFMPDVMNSKLAVPFVDLKMMDNILSVPTINSTLNHTTITRVKYLWYHMFLFAFVEPKFGHRFDDHKYFNHHTFLPLVENKLMFDEFIRRSTLYIRNSSYSLHELLLLKRSIALSCLVMPFDCSKKQILDTINHKLNVSTEQRARKDPIYFNIHLSKSAGTTICATFRTNGAMVSKSNCNVKPYTGAMFIPRNKDKGPQSCGFMTRLAKRHGYKLIASEGPMHGNNRHLHPELCDSFIYILPFRNPLERLLSALQMMYELRGRELNMVHVFPQLGTKDRDYNQWVNGFRNNTIFHKLFVEKHYDTWLKQNRYNSAIWKLLLSYLSNAMVRFIGYELPPRHKMQTWNGMYEDYEVVNNRSNDIHFYNAIKYMMQCDYVLPMSNRTLDPMWDVLRMDIVKQLRLDARGSFTSWIHKQSEIQSSDVNLLSVLSARDIEAIEAYNYYDLKLFQLAKWIAHADANFK